jgi:hypothetical protein
MGNITFGVFVEKGYSIVTIYDPRIGGAVIVETHSVEHAIGSVLTRNRKEQSA